MTPPDRFFFVLLAAVCGGILPASCSSPAPEEVESETVVPVVTEVAEIGNIRATIRATGAITPAPGAELVVVAPEPARIAEMPKAEGDAVASGDVLVRFDIPSTTAEVGRQRAELARAQAQLENARAAQMRARALFERGIAARKEVEDADRDVADAQAAIAQAQATLVGAEAAAGRAVVRAPFTGVVAKRLHNPGDLVEAASSDPVLRVIDPRRLEVTASIAIADVQRVAVGAAAHLSGGPAGTLRVVSRPAAVEQGTAAVPVRLAFATTAGGLPVGTPVQLEIEGEQHTGVVLVPTEAIVREGEESAVFVAMDDKAQRRVVMLGLVDDEHAEVRSGLKAGELVIVQGQAGLPDGATITTEAPQKP
jgi:RND family efflux transporter MFP subunit